MLPFVLTCGIEEPSAETRATAFSRTEVLLNTNSSSQWLPAERICQSTALPKTPSPRPGCLRVRKPAAENASASVWTLNVEGEVRALLPAL